MHFHSLYAFNLYHRILWTPHTRHRWTILWCARVVRWVEKRMGKRTLYLLSQTMCSFLSISSSSCSLVTALILCAHKETECVECGVHQYTAKYIQKWLDKKKGSWCQQSASHLTMDRQPNIPNYVWIYTCRWHSGCLMNQTFISVRCYIFNLCHLKGFFSRSLCLLRYESQ